MGGAGKRPPAARAREPGVRGARRRRGQSAPGEHHLAHLTMARPANPLLALSVVLPLLLLPPPLLLLGAGECPLCLPDSLRAGC